MAGCVALLAALAAVAGGRDSPKFLRFGADPAPGLLVNRSAGTRPFDPPDPARPTLVLVHGANPTPGIVHFTMAERLAEAVARRGGPPWNVMAWDWNAATVGGLTSRANEAAAVRQGPLLAGALWQAGLPPERVQLIGHSSGCIVAASAARTLCSAYGRPPAQLSLLDPAILYQDVIFDRLAAGSSAARVENIWAPGPSGYGREIARAGVWNVRVDGPTPYLGTVNPFRSSHLHVVEWYVATAGNPARPGGFNASLLVKAVRP
jgi:hypothetical protein